MSRRPVPPRARGVVPAAPVGTTATRRPTSRGTGPASGPRAGSTRPASRSSAAVTPAEDGGDNESRSVHLARLISVRALVLAVVLLIAFSMLFPTIRAYLGQRAEIDALAADVVAAEQAEQDLQAELDRWDDQAYVAAQARKRLSFVLPGETAYRVIDPEVVVEQPAVEGSTPVPTAGPALPAGGAVNPWYATVWDSVRIAGESAMPAEG